VNFVVNLVMYGKRVSWSEKFYMSGKIFWHLKWYTVRNFPPDWSGKIRKSRANFFLPP
jgi:hypothetical protein